MKLQVDHVTIASAALDRLADAFSEAGFPVRYGGEHSNDVTHMSQIGFPDGSYLELLSTIEPEMEAPKWNDPIRESAGPCAWAVAVDDIETATADLRDRGVRVDGPDEYRRRRADGTLVEWDLTFLGEGDPGSVLPFLISDRTPRDRRVQTDDDAASFPIGGIDTVVIGVPELDAAIERFTTAFDLSEPTMGRLANPSADVAVFPDQPVALARPRGQGWLVDRIEEFGPLPAAYLLEQRRHTDHRFEDFETDSLGDRQIEWLPVTEPVGHRYLGLVESTA